MVVGEVVVGKVSGRLSVPIVSATRAKELFGNEFDDRRSRMCNSGRPEFQGVDEGRW
jgi:hypothetical protein